ncbi:MAG: chemotaxis protein CheW [Planctomycetota bacterium]
MSENKTYVSCRVDSVLLGIDLGRVREINRTVDVTPVPRTNDAVRGLVNLRGELVTVLDLGQLLLGKPSSLQRTSRNVILRTEDESVGLLVDWVGDVVEAAGKKIEPVPFEVHGMDAGMFAGVIQLDSGLMVVLDVDAVTQPAEARERGTS